MPTPSNQSSDSSLTPPFAFSTCPDDVQNSPRPLQPTATEVRLDSSLYHAPSPALESPAVQGGHAVGSEHLMLDRQTSLEPSSRDVTVSPGPNLRTPELSSLTPSVPDGDSANARAVDPDGPAYRASSVAPRSPPADISASISPDIGSKETLPYDDDHDLACSTSLGMDFTSMRVSRRESFSANPHRGAHARQTISTSPSSFLRPGSRFHGTQQSERQVYEVQVEIKHVDMRESFLCGYLRIQGLTEDHPTLTTYFEGEIIGSKYGFITQHEDWGASIKTDMNHWGKFPAFRPLQKQVRKGPVTLHDVSQRDDIFMRWKEHFLVPDHRVRTIAGASFEGFYYICFNQLAGAVSGIYFHSKSEKFQQLELKHVPNRGCFSATEFR